MKYVFVYGTLRAGEINDINLAADRNAIARPRHLGLTSLSGRLFDFGTYPGMVAGAHDAAAKQADQQARVVGDVYEIDDALLAVLDEIEQVYPGVDGLFVSKAVSIEVQGERIDCLYYPVAPGAVAGRPEIASGDWVEHRRAR
ncbi:Gamma-glutamylcyclotransferase family protein [Paraburkholderia tropica]|uniref:gamma-glutamylcyclotransferase family protein n=1 Tax=Paraburkholderia TaxID=1822464 RepID=UPI001CABACB7|nr:MULTISPECIES: gamma-glutamylcyclotransferase family protein [Paraburkholderia]CAG9237059.1 Gamma-glutamylcyclotransferase family protein [Paraburkholderia tropica]